MPWGEKQSFQGVIDFLTMKAYKGNGKTGEEIPITARRVVTFRSGQKLKARVEAYVGSEQE